MATNIRRKKEREKEKENESGFGLFLLHNKSGARHYFLGDVLVVIFVCLCDLPEKNPVPLPRVCLLYFCCSSEIMRCHS